jgi:hypothetical protein
MEAHVKKFANLSEPMLAILSDFSRAPIKSRGEYSDGAGHVLKPIFGVDYYDQRSFNALVSRKLVDIFTRCACEHPCTCECNGWHITPAGVAALAAAKVRVRPRGPCLSLTEAREEAAK